MPVSRGTFVIVDPEAPSYPVWRFDPECSDGHQSADPQDAANAADVWLVKTIDSLAKISGITYARNQSNGLIAGTTDPGFTYYHQLIITTMNAKKKVRKAIFSNIIAPMGTNEKALLSAAATKLGVVIDFTKATIK